MGSCCNSKKWVWNSRTKLCCVASGKLNVGSRLVRWESEKGEREMRWQRWKDRQVVRWEVGRLLVLFQGRERRDER